MKATAPDPAGRPPFATGSEFHPDAVYRLNIDIDGDNQTDVALSAVFSVPEDGRQAATVYLAWGDRARQAEAARERIIADTLVSFDPEARIVDAGSWRFFAGVRSDPFFADVEGIRHGRWPGPWWPSSTTSGNASVSRSSC